MFGAHRDKEVDHMAVLIGMFRPLVVATETNGRGGNERNHYSVAYT